jgi:hypothetical protein
MLNPMSVELLAEQVQRDHLARVAHAALLAQLPRPTTGVGSGAQRSSVNRPLAALRPTVASAAATVTHPGRLHLANALRALATRLDPCAACDNESLVRIVNSR